MSQIFDALQRSEAERSGTDPAELSAAAELLEVAERQMAYSGDRGRRPDRRSTRRLRVTTRRRSCAIDQFSQFQSARVLVPPQSNLVCITEEDSLAAEKFRFLGVRLRHLQQKRPLKRLLITSSMAEEGKSTIAANLACALAKKTPAEDLAAGGRSTAALRWPEQFGLGKIPGLSELLQGEPAPAMNIYQLEGLGFWILPAGSPPRILWNLCNRGNSHY